ncbi:DUF3616 domain-containing protein [Jiella sp. MQZ9-1]|uniref:DUF3616 domain-containing protein n=1 Tax=Jiella flava TaxID=2816857 RepID=A0A939FY44_9HYPH|nr:DUF3616 domain-containing protein [Jiella flava]MBO0662320.1 DUF3616 domain-containing protein [Jiella flava]MCD2470851.1 DUF3616 domain-containing protein [Jiella flava]
MAKTRPTNLPHRDDAEADAALALDRRPLRRIDLFFTEREALDHVDDPIFEDVSSLAVIGRSIFCTCDETSTVERILVDDNGKAAGEHVNFVLGRSFKLPDGPSGEMDIEGLAIADGYLWICGSHSLKRDEPDDDDLSDFEDIDWDSNRGFLGRVPLLDRGNGVFDLVDAVEPLDDTPGRQAAMVEMTVSKKTPIRKMLKKDPLIGPFIDLPCKENGFDIEGLAVKGETVLLGLRGPVVGGFAMIVRMDMKLTDKGYLKPKKLKNGKRYALHAIDLNGQSIRDMNWQDDRLLILSGATTDLEALQSVFAVEDFDLDRQVHHADALTRILDLPAIRGSDHAEGIAILQEKAGARLLVAYDSPHDDRVDPDEQRLSVDVFELADPPAKAS